MKIVNGKLYISFQEALECGISENTLKDAKKKGTKCWDLIDDPADKRKVLVGFEALNDDRKAKVELRFGNPYDRVARMPILNMVVNDRKAHDYYMGYTYENGLKHLPPNRVNQYTRAASWLGMISKVQDDKRIIKKDLGLTVPEFFLHAGELIGVEKKRAKMEGYAGIDVLPADFPGTYQRLLEKAKKYKNESYDMLIDPLFGNKIGAKLGKVGENIADKEGAFTPERYEDQMAVIRYCSAQGNNLNAAQVEKMSNLVFKQKGWKCISRATVNRIINENEHLLTAGRSGKAAHNNNVSMQVKRKVTPHPLMYWTMDGWTVELLFQERGVKGMEYKRMVVVVVLDAWKKYPVGYAIGERENVELIKEANRNALIHVKELFGAPYIPWQTLSDNYQIKALTPFYQALAHLQTPAAVGNSKAKVIEPYFGYLNDTYCQLMPNWYGHNLDSKKKNQMNRELLDKNKHTFPDRAGVIRQIEAIIKEERRLKVAEYTATLLPETEYEQITENRWLRVFGAQLGTRTNTIVGQGIIKSIDGASYTYDSFEPAFRQHMHIDWMLYGDKNDLSKVLAVSPDEKMHFVLEQKRLIPMDIRSQQQEDRDYLQAISKFNKETVNGITELYASDAKRVHEITQDMPWNVNDLQEAAMKGMFTIAGQQKEGIQDAKGLGKAQAAIKKKEQRRIASEATVNASEWEKMQEKFMSERTNFNIYQ